MSARSGLTQAGSDQKHVLPAISYPQGEPVTRGHPTPAPGVAGGWLCRGIPDKTTWDGIGIILCCQAAPRPTDPFGRRACPALGSSFSRRACPARRPTPARWAESGCERGFSHQQQAGSLGRRMPGSDFPVARLESCDDVRHDVRLIRSSPLSAGGWTQPERSSHRRGNRMTDSRFEASALTCSRTFRSPQADLPEEVLSETRQAPRAEPWRLPSTGTLHHSRRRRSEFKHDP